MVLLTEDVVPLKVRHNVTGDDVFHQLAGYVGERDWAIADCCIPFAFFEDWGDVCHLPVKRQCSTVVGVSVE